MDNLLNVVLFVVSRVFPAATKKAEIDLGKSLPVEITKMTNVAVLEWLTAVKCTLDTIAFVMFTCLCSLGVISNKEDMVIRFYEGPQRLM